MDNVYNEKRKKRKVEPPVVGTNYGTLYTISLFAASYSNILCDPGLVFDAFERNALAQKSKRDEDTKSFNRLLNVGNVDQVGWKKVSEKCIMSITQMMSQQYRSYMIQVLSFGRNVVEYSVPNASLLKDMRRFEKEMFDIVVNDRAFNANDESEDNAKPSLYLMIKDKFQTHNVTLRMAFFYIIYFNYMYGNMFKYKGFKAIDEEHKDHPFNLVPIKCLSLVCLGHTIYDWKSDIQIFTVTDEQRLRTQVDIWLQRHAAISRDSCKYGTESDSITIKKLFKVNNLEELKEAIFSNYNQRLFKQPEHIQQYKHLEVDELEIENIVMQNAYQEEFNKEYKAHQRELIQNMFASRIREIL